VAALRLSDEAFSLRSKAVAEAAKFDGKAAEDYGPKAGKDGLLARIGSGKASTAARLDGIPHDNLMRPARSGIVEVFWLI
jgi:hypothetical protein